MEICQINQMQYRIEYPNDFSENKAYPLLLFLHGAGTRGDVNKLKGHPFFDTIMGYSDFPFVTVAPFCNGDTWFDVWEQLKAFVSELVALPYVDTERVYVMGASMGGYATWQLAMSMPETVAAIVPICGGGMYWNTARLKDIPVWAFHGAQDMTVRLEESQKMVDMTNKRGGNARLTVYPEAGHNAWSDTFANREVFEWLLSHKKSEKTSSESDGYTDSKTYG